MTLQEKYKNLFLIGAAVNTKTIETHKNLILIEFNSITCENEMKFSSVNPTGKSDEYDFTKADKIFSFAKSNDLSFRIHTLLWHNQTPTYIFNETTRNGLIERLKQHIDIMAERYGSKAHTCDVANEVIDDKSSQFFRSSPWHDIIGEDFCDIAFTYTKQKMPRVKLCYNDYNESNPEKSIKIYNLVKGMKERGAPIDTLGLQCHWSINSTSADDIKRAFELYSKLGVSLQITELDVSVFAFDDRRILENPEPDMTKKQTEFYSEVFKIFRDYHKIIDSVTTWGIADDATWLDNFPVRGRKNWPLLFDHSHIRKEAYNKIMDF